MFPSTESLPKCRLTKKRTHYRFGRKMDCHEIRTLVTVGRFSRGSHTDWQTIIRVVQVPSTIEVITQTGITKADRW
jgi:hypothetical protein